MITYCRNSGSRSGSMSDQVDIIIVGAGLVGTSVALALQKLDLSIVILENHLPLSITETKTDSRPISLSYGSHRILKALGVWDELATQACPILSVHVSEKKRFGSTRFSAAEEKVPALGYVVPFAMLQTTLYQHTAKQKNSAILPIQSIEKIHCDANGAEIIVNIASGKKSFQADLLIAADGTNSTCRELLHIDCNVKNNGDTAHIYRLALSESHDHTAYERFTEFGVLAILPLLDKKSAQLVWTITPRIAEKISTWDNEKKLAFLQDTFVERLSISAIKKFAEFPLQTKIADIQIKESAVLLGNSAHTIYPVAAQGFNLGLNDVATLADIIIDAHNHNQPIGALSTLKKYEIIAQKNQTAIYNMTNSLTTLFDFPLIGCARGFGLLATDLIHPIKNKLAKRAMGVAGKLSNIIRDRR